ncbi:titin-like [Xiphias gladius]|uniref:titin-like n=1 Tax=Xiphias gladius TaxID=8245 RepID=UPI001A98BCB1|nr:titin-like [Xiphias gladius]
MELLRKYFWALVIFGMIFVSCMISLIFLLINKCISRQEKHRISLLQRESLFSVKSNEYQERDLEANIPPLPPRTQFLTAEAQSYENLAEVPEHQQSIDDYEQNTDDYEQNIDDYEEALPEYEEALPEYEEALPEYEQALPEYEEALPEYEQALPEYEEALPEYEEALDDQPDYVKVEDEKQILPPLLPYQDPDPAEDNASTEDYDDIGDENQGEEDYDDVG